MIALAFAVLALLVAALAGALVLMAREASRERARLIDLIVARHGGEVIAIRRQEQAPEIARAQADVNRQMHEDVAAHLAAMGDESRPNGERAPRVPEGY